MPTDLELAEQHAPRLILYREINSPERAKRKNWRRPASLTLQGG